MRFDEGFEVGELGALIRKGKFRGSGVGEQGSSFEKKVCERERRKRGIFKGIAIRAVIFHRWLFFFFFCEFAG